MTRSAVAGLGALALTLLAGPASGASAVPPSPVSIAGLFQVVVGLAVVLAAIFGTGWLLRRLGPAQGGGGVLRVVGGVMVGPRERVVLVEVGDEWLVLGVASGGVRLLHRLPRPTAEQSAAGATEASAWLQRLRTGTGPRP
ncbi:MAG: flagellar biosynthetic protein FliO [Pseudomonadota bacterium]|jgi:flagellar protein FliO/FliZ